MTLFKRVFNTHTKDASPVPAPPVEEPEVERAFDREFSSGLRDADDAAIEDESNDEPPQGGTAWERDYNLLLHPVEDDVLAKQSPEPEPEPLPVRELAPQALPEVRQETAPPREVAPTMAERAAQAQSEIAASMASRGVRQDRQTAPIVLPEPMTPEAAPAPSPMPTPELEAQPAAIASARPGRSARRVRTRMLGFDSGAEATADPFAKGTTTAEAPKQVYPVGWMVVIEGPGTGHSFPLFNGVSTIGRGTDQSVALDFDDTSISREKHAAVAYDDESNSFFLGHGGKSNIVRLNNRPVLSTEDLAHGDTVRLGETTLRFVALCGSDFAWGKSANGDA